MNFYFSLFQLIETVESLGRNVQHLASRALRISPRDARANRELLEKCELKLNEVRVLLNNKTHIRKIVLRKASYLFQYLGCLLPPGFAPFHGDRQHRPGR